MKYQQVKLFVCPITAFSQMAEYGPEHDYKITREGRGLETRYVVESLGETVVADEIENSINATLKVYSFTDIFVNNIEWKFLEGEAEPILSRFDILDL